jgi:RimJ/RimL family protein N-acetyltransferase
MIVGDRIYLTPIEAENAEVYRAWINDPDVNRWLVAGQVPLTAEAERKTVREMDASEEHIEFEIRLREDDRAIGLCGLQGIEMRHRQGVVGICIGEKGLWGQGYGREAIVLVLRFGFDTLGLHRIEISAFEGNDRGLHLYESIGFKPAGRQRERIYIHGRFRDAVLFDMLEDEFRERYGTVPAPDEETS